jgi:uncharacterized protein YndB with AHSA1/START domain
MTDRSVKHSTYTIERTYAAPPAAVFEAWSDPVTKATWFAPQDGRYSLDFRVGGTEAVHGGDGVELVARSEYHDIVTDERIVYTTAMFDNEVLSTVSLTTVLFTCDGEEPACCSSSKGHSWTTRNRRTGASRASATGSTPSAVR